MKYWAMLSVALYSLVFIDVSKAGDAAFGIPISPNAHLYTYFVINGMARGEFMLGRLRQKDMPVLIHMDEVTRKIILHNLSAQTIRSDFQADQVLKNYLDLFPH
ncbi:hypothetical protein BG621_07380 [Parasaccharibacter apium]|nr:hypothetical protein BG621_07380 [Parasaccharibacter apium]